MSVGREVFIGERSNRRSYSVVMLFVVRRGESLVVHGIAVRHEAAEILGVLFVCHFCFDGDLASRRRDGELTEWGGAKKEREVQETNGEVEAEK